MPLVTVTGNLKTLLGAVDASGSVVFQLTNLGAGTVPLVSGTNVLVPLTATAIVAVDGSFSAALQGNDTITPANTLYAVTFYAPGGAVGPILYNLTGAAVNLNTATPSSSSPPILVPTSANANQVYAGPGSGAAAVPTFRALVSADIPTALAGSYTVAGLNGVLMVGVAAGQFGSLQAAHDALPAGGGSVFVTITGTPFGAANATPLIVTKQVRIMFDVGAFTYAGAGAAMTTASTSGSGITIEGAASADENLPTRGTSIAVTNVAAGGIDMQNCQSCLFRNFALKGPGSGTGIGANLSGNGFTVENVMVNAFGGVGVQIDGTRANSNSFVLRRVKSTGNGGAGFSVFGANSNLGTWIATNGMANTGTNYVFNGTFDHSFVGIHAQPSTDVTSMQFIGSSGNWGSVYIEPISPFAANVITFDATSSQNNIHLFNGRKVSDLGSGNLVFFAAGDAGAGIAGWSQGTRRTSPVGLVDSVFAPVEQVQRTGAATELTQAGIFFKSANVISGWTRTGAASLNWIYNTSAGAFAARWFNNCTGDISLCTPTLALGTTGITSENGLAPTGTGALVRATSPTLTSPVINTGVTGTALSGTGTLLATNTGPAVTNAALTTPTVGGGTVLTKYSRFAVSISPAAVPANNCVTQTFTVTGIAAADILIAVSKPTEQGGLAVMPGHVLGINSVSLNFCNVTGVAITPTAAETYHFIAVQ